VPCHDHAVLKATSEGHGTARHGHGMTCVNVGRPDGMWATCTLSASSGYHAEFHESCYQKHTNPLNCRTSSSDISVYHADFHEGHGTVGEWQERGIACVSQTRPQCINQMGKTQSKPLAARRFRGTAWAQHGHSMGTAWQV
jgi:hypothetical protein